jgi:hypothetical protein
MEISSQIAIKYPTHIILNKRKLKKKQALNPIRIVSKSLRGPPSIENKQ